MQIIDGKKTREELLPGLLEKIKSLRTAPCLLIVQVGERPDSTAFIGAKKRFAQILGVIEKHIQLPESCSEKELMEVVKKNNADPAVHGIVIQLPLPKNIDAEKVIECINPNKDVDGLTSTNVKKWTCSNDFKSGCMPATARGIKELLENNKIVLQGKHVAVLGRSNLVGKPITMMCLNSGATVTVCSSKTKDLEIVTKSVDIIISAVGKPALLNINHVKQGQIIIDVGINRDGQNRLVGDADFENIKDVVQAITPVPGGVGPMTVFALFENLVDLATISSE